MNIIETINGIRDNDLNLNDETKFIILKQKIIEMDKEIVDLRKTLHNVFTLINLIIDGNEEISDELRCLKETVDALIREVG